MIANGVRFHVGVSLMVGLTWTSAAVGVAASFPNAQRAAGREPISVAIGELIRVPPNVTIQRHYYNASTGESGTLSGVAGGIDPDTISYANAPQTHIYMPGSGRFIADDVVSIAVSGCPLTAYEINVGGVLFSDPFTVNFSLWDGCPSTVGTQIVPGTEGSVSGLAGDALHLIEVTLDPPIQIPESFYFKVTFDRDFVGWLVGTPAEVGYTANTFDTPGFACQAWTGIPGRYGGFHFRTFCELPFEREFLAYLNADVDGPIWSPGAGRWITDDITLIVDDCVLSSYEIAGQGNAPFSMEAELRTSCSPAGLIPGTQGSASARGDDTPEILRVDFPGGVQLPPGDKFWLAWSYTTNASAIIAGQAELGFTEDTFGLDPDGCVFFFGGNPWSGFDITLRCLGEPPKGACCDLDAGSAGTSGPALCRELPEIACQGPLVRYSPGMKCPGTCSLTGAICDVDGNCTDRCTNSGNPCPLGTECEAGETCDPQTCTLTGASFDPPCGFSACCEPPDENGLGEGCTDRPYAEAPGADGEPVTGCSEILDGEGHAAVWQQGQFCNEGDQYCVIWACRFAEGACNQIHGAPGCNFPSCCQAVCDLDWWCCDAEWDGICTDEANWLCPDLPPPLLAGGQVSSDSAGSDHPDRSDQCRNLDPVASEATVANSDAQMANGQPEHREVLDDPWLPRSTVPPPGVRTGRTTWTRGGYTSVQVNVDELGQNIPGDAANEPSIALDRGSPNRIVIGWRQFDTIESNFRQAGWAYSDDAGRSWTFPGVLEDGVFRSDPVLEADGNGNMNYYSLAVDGGLSYDLFKSTDGGITWDDGVFAYGGDKGWMTIDRTEGVGRGHIYASWSGAPNFTRSTDGGATFVDPVPYGLHWGTLDVGPAGEVYGSGTPGFPLLYVGRSDNAQHASVIPSFDSWGRVDLGGVLKVNLWYGPNPTGLLGQMWVATDHSETSMRGNVYVLASVGSYGPTDVMLARSTDRGVTWSAPIRVNDDPPDTGAWHWFGTMSVAPNGRIDAIWNDTRNTGQDNLSELYYAYSTDAGLTWSQNVPVSPVFDSHIGWPNQQKIGDYYDMVSDNSGVNIAYAATFNGEQDVYFLRIGQRDCNTNGVEDSEDVANATSDDCNANSVPDECERDCNGTLIPDSCDLADGTSVDCDGNSIPDECDPDFDGDGIIDSCDTDIDQDGILNETDVCDFTPLGVPALPDGRPLSDTNGNCKTDLVDYLRFMACMLESGPDTVSPRPVCAERFGYDDDDDDVDLGDFAAFQRAFTGSPP